MKFNKKEIGSLYVYNKQFYMISGYDFIENKYILVSLDKFFNNRQYVLLSDNYTKTNYLEILQHFEEDKKDLFQDNLLHKSFENRRIGEIRKNYQIEIDNIPNKFFEIDNEIRLIRKELKNPLIENKMELKNKYEKKLSNSLKGMRRLEKRLYFFFGDESVNVLMKLMHTNATKYYSSKYKYEKILEQEKLFKENFNELKSKLV